MFTAKNSAPGFYSDCEKHSAIFAYYTGIIEFIKGIIHWERHHAEFKRFTS